MAELRYNRPKMAYYGEMQRAQQPPQDAPRVNQRYSANRSQLKHPAASKDYERDVRNNQPIKEHRRRRQDADPPPDYVARSSRISSSQNTPKRVQSDYDSYEQSAPQLLTFSGNPSEYYHWERNLEECFAYYDLPRSKRVSKSLKLLTGKAWKWWEEEEEDRCYYGEPPITTWTQLKRILREMFAPELQSLGQPHPPKEKEITISSKSARESKETYVQSNRGKHESKSAPMEEVVCYPETGELMELGPTLNTTEELIEPQREAPKEDGPKEDVTTKQELIHHSEIDKLQVAEPPTSKLCKHQEPEDEAEDKISTPILAPLLSYKPVGKLLCNETTVQTDQLLLTNPCQLHQKVKDLQVQEPREQGHSKEILLLTPLAVLNSLTIKEPMLLMLFREGLISGQEDKALISVINEKHREKEGYAKSGTTEDESVTQLDKLQNELLSVVSTKRELFSVTKSEAQNYMGIKENDYEDRSVLPPSKPRGEPLKVATRKRELSCATLPKPEVTSAVRNSLSLDILHQLLAYVKGLIEIEKSGMLVDKTMREGSILVLQRKHEVDSTFQFVLVHIGYTLKSTITHLLFVLEVEYLAGIQRRLEGNVQKFVKAVHPKKEQEVTSVLTSAKPLFLSMNVVQGSGLITRYNGTKDVKEEPPDQRIMRKQEAHLFITVSTSGKQGVGLVQGSIGPRNVKEKPPDHYPKETQEYISVPTSATVWNEFFQSDFKGSMTVIMHLLLSLSVKQGAGFIKNKIGQEDIKEEPPDPREHEHTRRRDLGTFTKELNGELSTQEPISTKNVANPDVNGKGTLQFKEEPPDFPHSVSFPGKSLNPSTLPWTNFLCVGDQVLRSKLFEEGGYDEDMTSMNLGRVEPEKTQPEGPTEAAQDLPYLLVPEGYFAVITSGVTKEITASSQEPDQTSNTSRQDYWRLNRGYQRITVKIPKLPYPPSHHFLPSHRPFSQKIQDHAAPSLAIITTLIQKDIPTARRYNPLHLFSIITSPPLLHFLTHHHFTIPSQLSSSPNGYDLPFFAISLSLLHHLINSWISL